MIKKILKIIGIAILLLIISAFAIPYFFQDQIKAKITKAINEKVDAKVSFKDADLSLFKSFPQANVTVEKLLIINKAPFEGDTLIALDELNLKMSIKELFKGKEEPMNIDAITTENGSVNILFNKDGVGNFDIALKNAKQSEEKNKPLSLKIKEYKITNLKFKYFDEVSKINVLIDSINHSGEGDFEASKLDLVTKSTGKITVDMDKINYMNRVPLTLDAIVNIDLEQSKYTFKENKALVNQLPLEFDGFIQLVDAGQNYNLTFKTPTSSFKNFLGLIPSAYASRLEGVKTTGEFTVKGFAKGLYSDQTVPKFNIAIASKNASFQYPNLPKSVDNIIIDTKIINETGILNDTYVNLDQLSFRIDQDIFSAKANIRNITENPFINAELKGIINLANASKAYPVKSTIPLSGILNADVATQFDMKSVETNQYEKMKNSGYLTLTGFKYVDENNKLININKAELQFTNTRINLQELDLTTGKTDLSINGILENFYGFMFKNQELKGDFNMQSKQFAVADFMSPATSKSNEKQKEEIKIPAFLNCTLTARANTVLYDNLTLRDVSGKMIIKEEKITLENMKSTIFNGLIGLNGSISTKGKIPTFDMDLNLKQVDIEQSFTQLDLLKKIAPIAGIVNGKLNSIIKLNGTLNPTAMTPDLKTLTGDLIGQFLSTTISADNSTLLTTLTSNIKFIDLSKINLNDIKAALSFKDGKVNVKPFNIKYQDVKAVVSGTHGFDQSMNYNLKFDVPAKYLGNEANALISKLSPSDAAKLENIPITAFVTGTFTNPKVTTDTKAAVTNFAKQITNQQKDKLIKQGTSELDKLLNNGSKTPADTTKTKTPKEEIKTKATDILNSFLKKK
jgi:hypothetical protein